MTSKAETIADAVETALTTPAMTSVPAARVFRDVNAALRSELFPAIVVELGDERAPVPVMIGYKDRYLDCLVTVLAEGANPYSEADAAVVESYNRLFADRTLGGVALDLEEGETTRERDSVGESVGAVRKRYTVSYRTTESSLES